MPGSAEHRALAGIDEAGAVALLRRLVETPSHNPPGDEAAVVAVLADALQDAGIEPAIDEVHPGRPNLSASCGGEGGPVLVLNGHTDTMPAGDGWTTDPYRAVERDGRLYGLGSADMKAGVAAMISALCAVRRAGVALSGRVIVDAVIDEEAGGTGTLRTVANGRRADFAIILEPTGLDVVRVGNGQVNFEVVFTGTAGHGSAPEAGHNAIYDAAAFVAAVEGETAALARERHPLTGPATYNVGVVDGGLRTSIIPARCVVEVDRRIVPGQTVESAIADLDDLLERTLLARRGARAERTVGIRYAPFEVPERSDVCTVVRQAASEAAGRQVAFTGMRATTDAVFLAGAGTPTIVFGPGSIEQAHRPDEWVSLAEFLQAVRALVLTIVRLLR